MKLELTKEICVLFTGTHFHVHQYISDECIQHEDISSKQRQQLTGSKNHLQNLATFSCNNN